ncbi:competence/damage-inducible protein A [Massilibacterium senegalense]|uniref:competence/damage-inducible protein A n=1 Tax=Massilibacterium senegalense TaxID=1632858 RepID=UPI000784D23F|nr:competence/damage-inducible protein A [Massilibacterium senegalense]
MNAEIIAVGSELLLGQIANTNAQFMSEQLAELGINVYYHTVVGDNEKRLEQVIDIARNRSDVIIFTGGLGPTKDDLTKETIARMLHKSLVMDQQALQHLEDYFQKTNRIMTENNKKQALVIDGCKILKNDVGMAPGMIYEDKDDDKIYLLFPGVPKEMKEIFIHYAIPYLYNVIDENAFIESHVLRFFSIGESQLEHDLQDLIDEQTNPTIAPLAKDGEVTIRITAKHEIRDEALQMIAEVEGKILARVGEYFYGYNDTSLQKEAVALLKKKMCTIASAESLTGGLFGKMITEISGASSIYRGGIVCYANEVKEQLLHVPKEVLATEGAVSETTARILAEEVRRLLRTDIGISFTGVAGPEKSEGKDVGTVYLGVASQNKTEVYLLTLAGSRESIRKRTANYGFYYIMKHLKKGI